MKNKRKQRKEFHHLIQYDRDRMEILLRERYSQEDVAVVLKVDPGIRARSRSRR